MKIAGRKNDGAWFRTNKVIQSLSNAERTALQAKFVDMGSMPGWLECLQAFGGAAGYTAGDPEYPSDSIDIAINYSTGGIPRQAWYGRLSYDIYDRTGTAPNYVYTPQWQPQAHEFGKEIRKLMKQFLMARRQAKDLPNVVTRAFGNPGGVANATEGD